MKICVTEMFDVGKFDCIFYLLFCIFYLLVFYLFFVLFTLFTHPFFILLQNKVIYVISFLAHSTRPQERTSPE